MMYTLSMRTTIRLNDNILKLAKKTAAERHTTLTALIDAGLRYVLSLRTKTVKQRNIIRIRSVGRGGLRSGVNLDNNAALLEKMEQ